MEKERMRKAVFNEDGSFTWQTMTAEEEEKFKRAQQTDLEKLPGTGTCLASYRLDSKHPVIEFRMPQKLYDEMQPGLENMKKLMGEACVLFTKAWKLADSRCRQIINGISDSRKEQDDYIHEQGLIRVRLAEIRSDMNEIKYDQYRKALKANSVPKEVAEPMKQDLECYESMERQLDSDYVDRTMESEQKLKKHEALKPTNLHNFVEQRDTASKCIRAQMEAYKCTRDIRYIRDTKPFFDSDWFYRGEDAVDKLEYVYAEEHDYAWVMATWQGRMNGGERSPEAAGYIRPMLIKEYGLKA